MRLGGDPQEIELVSINERQLHLLPITLAIGLLSLVATGPAFAAQCTTGAVYGYGGTSGNTSVGTLYDCTVPSGVTSMEFELRGGDTGGNHPWGQASPVTQTVSVTPNSTIQLVIGAQGEASSGADDGAGGSSAVLDGNSVLVIAPGGALGPAGSVGNAGDSNKDGGAGGAGYQGGAGGAGADGQNGSSLGSAGEAGGNGGTGGAGIGPGSTGGAGGNGGNGGNGAYGNATTAGGDGGRGGHGGAGGNATGAGAIGGAGGNGGAGGSAGQGQSGGTDGLTGISGPDGAASNSGIGSGVPGTSGDGFIEIMAMRSRGDGISSVPTLGEWGMGMLASLLALGGLAALRRKRQSDVPR